VRARAASPLGRFRQPALLLACVVAYGTVGYLLIERWSLLDALYMTLITISTVGFQEVHTLSTAGRIFTITLIVGGVGTMLYALGLFAELLAQGQLASYRRQRQMERRVTGLRDHFIVCGYGRIGTQIVREFDMHRVNYVVIDNNPEAVQRLQREDRLHLEGDAAGEEVLKAAGILLAKGLICAVDSDERAVYITLAARALNPNLYLLARAGRPESVRRLELAGANRVLSPYRMAGHRMAEMAVRPALVDLFDALHHGEAEVGVEEILVPPGCRIIGRTLEQAGLMDASRAQLLALRRRDGSLHVKPAPGLEVQAEDLIVALGSESQLSATATLIQ
jgi:voltage-gated potassium channel